jgi:putative oxidoreductase
VFPQLTHYSDYAILLLRLMVALVYVASGWADLMKPAERGKGLGLSTGLTIFIGAAEVAGGLGIAFGVLTQLAAFGLIVIMLGAMDRKIRVWKTGFWGEKNDGWQYDLNFILMLLVIITTNGGRFILWK